ncbi:hypothetical protein GQ42DRAFT_88530 [Ramicandelaber brevisporus]|nr:hypothetical protein GQ42DRAFT_88530 [Ramicandelaber brevisporus]
MSVSPYETIPLESASKWPSLMITSGMNDQRVAYWQPLKYAARLRSRLPHIYQTSESGSPTLIMHTADDGDHFSSSSSDSGGDEYPSHWQAMAERTAFLINALNVQ